MFKKIVIPGREMFDSKTNKFSKEKDIVLEFEHSLYTIQKWESKWHVPFLNNKEKTEEQNEDYFRCMCRIPNVPRQIFRRMTRENIKELENYISDPMTATTFGKKEDDENEISPQIITAEIIYYWMVELNIPSEYQHWHLNQLLTLIKVINIKHKEAEEKSKNKGKKKPLTRDQIEKRKRLNEARRKKYNTNG